MMTDKIRIFKQSPVLVDRAAFDRWARGLFSSDEDWAYNLVRRKADKAKFTWPAVAVLYLVNNDKKSHLALSFVPRVKFEAMTGEEFARHGGMKCPFCGSEDIEGDPPSADGPMATSDGRCNTCESAWKSKWRVVGYFLEDD
jgi:hypothetical protein